MIINFIALDHKSLLLSAIKSVTNKKITSSLAIAAKELAFEILDKAESDGIFASTSLKSFSLQLISHLLPFTSKSCIDKEMKLDEYHKYRTSTSFHYNTYYQIQTRIIQMNYSLT